MTSILRALALLLLIATPVRAHDEDAAMNRVSFQVEVSREVANDQVAATMGVTEEGADAAELADRVNKTMTWALEQTRGKQVRVESGSYQTHPVYEKGAIRRWRASQDVVLESDDHARVVELIGVLQSRLLLRSLRFHVSPERRREVEDELIEEALAAFQARAGRVQKSLGRRGHAIVRISVNTRGGGPPPGPVMRMEAASVAKPATAAGASTLSVSVSGTIELE
jgi:predicted secreted protein